MSRVLSTRRSVVERTHRRPDAAACSRAASATLETLESRRLLAAQIEVLGNGMLIANGDTTPSLTDHTDFGAANVGASALTRTFTVRNAGDETLDLPFEPGHPGPEYTIIEPLADSLAPGASDSFTLRLSTDDPGTFSGEVAIASNDPSDAIFTFAITGKIGPTSPPPPPPPPSGDTIKINFQPAGRPVPTDYFADTGATFGSRGNGLTYGWNQSISSATRDRGINADQRLDTLVHTQLYGSRTWEIGLPNGTYEVKLAAGDPQFFDSVYRINVEGQLSINATPTSGIRFFQDTETVTVSDGRLTVSNASGAQNNKLNFIEITPVSNLIRINFQQPGSATPAGYLADSGATFGSRGNGFSYGWNATASSFARDRNNGLSPDQRFDTLIHTQLYGSRTWELGVTNGTYQVRLVAGDPSFTDSVYKIDVEGLLTVNGTPSSANRWIEGLRTVTVSDGRLTITNASGAVNNKLAFVEVTPL